MQGPVVLFDGLCRLCSGVVDFVIRRDPRRRFRFAPLQGETARRLLREHGRMADGLDTLVLIEDGGTSVRSTAARRIARRLPFPWSLLGICLQAVPAAKRHRAYDLVARRRHRWFGVRETCRLPAPGEADRFLE